MYDTPATTNFRILADSMGQDWEMAFTIPRALSQSDWEEIARLLKMAMVTLSKLPVDNAQDIIEA